MKERVLREGLEKLDLMLERQKLSFATPNQATREILRHGRSNNDTGFRRSLSQSTKNCAFLESTI